MRAFTAQVDQTAALRHQEEEERECFPAIFESKYGAEAPELFNGSFVGAVASARAQQRFLLVWLFGDDPASEALGSILCGEVLKAFVSQRFILWPGDADRWLLPAQLKQYLRLSSVPVLLILRPLSVYDVPHLADPCDGHPVEFPRDAAWSLLGCWDASTMGVDVEAVVNFLAEHEETAAQENRLREQELQFQREYTEEARLLRQQQDEEFESSANEDRQRAEAAAREAEEAERERLRVVAEEAAVDAARTSEQAEAAALAADRRGAAAVLLASPVPSEGERCTLVIRLSDGQRVERVFGADDLLADVYAWANCSGELSALMGKERFEVPRSFQLATTYPRRELVDQTRTLRELHLLPNAILVLC